MYIFYDYERKEMYFHAPLFLTHRRVRMYAGVFENLEKIIQPFTRCCMEGLDSTLILVSERTASLDRNLGPGYKHPGHKFRRGGWGKYERRDKSFKTCLRPKLTLSLCELKSFP